MFVLSVHVQHEFNSNANTYFNGFSICSARLFFFIFYEPSMLHCDNFSHRCTGGILVYFTKVLLESVVVTLSFNAKMVLANFECNLNDKGLPEMGEGDLMTCCDL